MLLKVFFYYYYCFFFLMFSFFFSHFSLFNLIFARMRSFVFVAIEGVGEGGLDWVGAVGMLQSELAMRRIEATQLAMRTEIKSN